MNAKVSAVAARIVRGTALRRHSDEEKSTALKSLTEAMLPLAITLAVMASMVAHSTPIAYEGLNYGVGVDLNAQAQPAQFGGWKGGAYPGITTAAGSLSYGKLVTSGNKVSGGNWQSTGMRMNFSNSAWDPYKVNVDNVYTIPYPGAFTTVIGKNGTALYVSFLMQSTAAQEAHFGLYTGDTNADPFGQLAVGAAVNVTAAGTVTLRTGSYNPGTHTFDAVSQNGATDATHTVQNAASLSVSANSVNFYVLKVEFGVTDKVSLFLNPTVGGTEPGTASASLTTPANEDLIFVSFATFLGYGANCNYLDEVCFGSTWADVTPVPLPVGTVVSIR